MINQEVRDQLQVIQSALRQVFPPEYHEIRELPGKGYWVFISHHQYRERLDAVYPEWESSYTQIEQIASDVVCKCSITILGITKQAIGSVPLVAAERNGKDVSRGSAADRLAAEAFKNACEAWGIGRYLDSQGSVANYLNQHAIKLDYKTRNKLKPLGDYLRQTGELPPINSNVTQPTLPQASVDPGYEYNEPTGKTITEAQNKRLWAIAKGLDSSVVKKIAKDVAGVESTKDIPTTSYDKVIQVIEGFKKQPTDSDPGLPRPVPERDLLAQEINSLRKRKGIPKSKADEIMAKITGGEKDSKDYSDLELLKIRDEFALLPNYSE